MLLTKSDKKKFTCPRCNRATDEYAADGDGSEVCKDCAGTREGIQKSDETAAERNYRLFLENERQREAEKKVAADQQRKVRADMEGARDAKLGIGAGVPAAEINDVPKSAVHAAIDRFIQRENAVKIPRSEWGDQERAQIPARNTKAMFGHGNTVHLNRAVGDRGYEIHEYNPSGELVARHDNIPFSALDRMMQQGGHADSLLRIDDSKIPDQRLYWSAKVHHAPQTHKDGSVWHHETLSPMGDSHKISTGQLEKSDEHRYTEFLEKLEKCDDPIASKEQPKIDTREKAEIPAEQLLVHKNGQWELKKGDIIDFKTKKVIAHVPTEEKTQEQKATEEKAQLTPVPGGKANLPPPPKHPPKTASKEQKITAAMAQHGQHRGEQHEADMRHLRQQEYEEKFKEIQAQNKEKEKKDRIPLHPFHDSGHGDDIKKEELALSERGQWSIEKTEMGRGEKPKDISMFTSDHINQVVGMPHDQAKAHAHAAVDASSAKPENKAKAKLMIDRSKSSKHLAMGMGNFLLASEGLGTGLKKE